MDCIGLMMEEHGYIKRMLAVIRRYCYKILKNEDVRYEDFFSLIDFVRSYADRHHHGKEETLLFNRMLDELGPIAEKLIRHGMLVEHDLGRMYMQELETAVNKAMAGDDESRLDVIANAISYTHLLTRHIDKEDEVVYKFAKTRLSKETMEAVERDCSQFEQDGENRSRRKKYLEMLAEFEARI